METLRGQLLIAPPHLSDGNFTRTVVLMIQHDREGALGLVLNRPSTHPFSELWEKVRGGACEREERLSLGGPVAGPLMVLHGEPDAGDPEVIPGVFCCTDVARLEQLLEESAAPMRFFAGYSGWGEGQLEGELQTGSWLTAPADVEHVFPPRADELWDDVFRKIVDDASRPEGLGDSEGNPIRN